MTPSPTSRPLRRYRLEDLTRLQGRQFVVACFCAVLGRQPEEEAVAHYCGLLRSGMHKFEVVARVRYSQEGRAYGAVISGLSARMAWLAFTRIPLFGYLFEALCLVSLLPSIVRRQREIEARLPHATPD